MEEDKDIQIQVKKTPVFTVLKNGSILKNIFLLRKPSSFSTAHSAVDTSSTNEEPNEEVLLVGRHPDCNITLEHPSISRYHLRIHSNPSSHMLSIVDLSSVHGTWVSGKKIEPGIPVKLKEGDTVKMGGSSRVYELHWVPLSQAFDVNDPFVPATFRKQQETQDESCWHLETHSSDEDLESWDLSISNKNLDSSMEKLNPLAPNYLNTELEEHMSPSKTNNHNGESFRSITGIENQSWVNNETTKEEALNSSKADDFDSEHSSLNKIEDESNSLRDNTGNESDDPFFVPNCSESSIPVVTESISETEIVDLLTAIKTHEEDALNQDIARFNEIDIEGTENEQINQTDSMLVCTSRQEVDMSVKFESVIMKKETFNHQVSRTRFDSLDGKESEFFTPDKENKDPNARLVKSNICTMLKEAVSPTVNEGIKDIFHLADEVLFSSATSRSMKMAQTAQKIIDSSKKKRWTMVLDTNTLLHKESLKHLKLLQGLKGTQLFIPKTVLKELMDIKSQHDLFNITTKNVSLALKWIDECIITTRWWIHIDDEIQTVLQTAIHLCKEIKHGKIIILSNHLSLKIKAMSQGILCEEAQEFFRSLVNPYSDRFMWVGSLARGLTWSCLDVIDDDILRENYRGFGLNESNRFKGLKLLAYV